MKYCLMIAFFLVQNVKAQTTVDLEKAWIVKTDILSPAVGLINGGTYYSFTIEKNLRGRNSLQLSYSYGSFTNSSEGDWDFQRDRGFVIVPQYKVFFRARQKGWFSGGYMSYGQEDYQIYLKSRGPANSYEMDFTQHYMSLGGLLGYQNYLWKRLCYEFAGGAGYRQILRTDVKKSVNVIRSQYLWRNGLDAMLMVNVGWRF